MPQTPGREIHMNRTRLSSYAGLTALFTLMSIAFCVMDPLLGVIAAVTLGLTSLSCRALYVLLDPAQLPFGYVIHKVESSYAGHPQGLSYGEGSETVELGVRRGVHLPELDLFHGPWTRHWIKALKATPKGTLIRDKGRWRTIAQFVAESKKNKVFTVV